MADQFVIHGLDAVLLKMRTFSEKLQKKGARTAVRKGANVVRDAARIGAGQIDDPETSESIQKNITVQFSARQGKREGGLVARVGVLGGARSNSSEARKARRRRSRQGISSLEELGQFSGMGSDNPGGDTFYWRFLEFGTSKMAARPFMRPALENNTERVTAVVVTELDAAIDKIAAQHGLAP